MNGKNQQTYAPPSDRLLKRNVVASLASARGGVRRDRTHQFQSNRPRGSSEHMRSVREAQPRYHDRRSSIPLRYDSGEQKRPKRSIVWRLLAVCAILAIGILGTDVALTSTTFRVEQVNIMGTHNQKLGEAIQHMGIQGQNIFRLDVTTIASRIEHIPLVSTVVLEKRWPNQLIISVTERVPVLLWQTSHGTYSVDRQGVVIAPKNETIGTENLPTVFDPRNQQATRQQLIHPGTRLDGANIAFATEILTRLPQMVGVRSFRLRYDGTISQAAGNGSFVIEGSDGWVVYIGGTDDSNPLDNRLIELQQILGLAQQQGLTLATIDVRFGLRPVYTLKT